MLLVDWKDFYGDKDPKAFIYKPWRYSESQIAAINLTAKRRKIIESKYRYAQLVAGVSPQVEGFVLKLYEKFMNYNLSFVKVGEDLSPGNNVTRWKVSCDKKLPISIEVCRYWGYHDCGLYDYHDVEIKPRNHLSDPEKDYLKHVILSMFGGYITEKNSEDRVSFLNSLNQEI